MPSVPTDLLTITTLEAVRVLTLNDPARRNALSMEMRFDLIAALDAALVDPDVRVVVLTGAGGAFCAGGDLTNMPPESDIASRERLNLMADLIRLVATSDKPVIAAVEGAAAGAGLSLAAACDHVIASESSTFVCSFVRVGLAPDAGLFWTLPQRVGMGAAKELLMFGEPVDASRALSIGLVDVLCPEGAALETAVDRAGELATRAPLALAAIKGALAQAPLDLRAGLFLEQAAQVRLLASADFLEGKDAFLERRRATFTGS